MSGYTEDKKFTDMVHSKLAIDLIYNKLGWELINDDDGEYLDKIDYKLGIDYVAKLKNGRTVAIQERFREEQYKRYSDITLRYRRDINRDEHRHESEYFKIQAKYIVYGIINKTKLEFIKNPTDSKFVKFAVIDLDVLFKKIDSGEIVIGKSNVNINNQDIKYIAKISYNRDGSSSFVAFDIVELDKLFKDDGIILLQDGYF